MILRTYLLSMLLISTTLFAQEDFPESSEDTEPETIEEDVYENEFEKSESSQSKEDSFDAEEEVYKDVEGVNDADNNIEPEVNNSSEEELYLDKEMGSESEDEMAAQIESEEQIQIAKNTPVKKAPKKITAKSKKPNAKHKNSTKKAIGLDLTLKQAQIALNKSGEKLNADGKMGPRTRKAIQKFQKKNGLPQTGVLDKVTKKKLGV